MNTKDIKLIHGDCIEEMQKLIDEGVKVDMVLCDLPYGLTNMPWDEVIPFGAMWECINGLVRCFDTPVLLFGCQPFSSKLINSNIANFKYELIWNKNVPTGMAQAGYRPMRYHENILVFNSSKSSTYNPQMKGRVGKGKSCYNYDHYCGDNNHIQMGKVKRRYDPDLVQPSSVINFNVVPNRKGKLHPCEKPVDMLRYLVKTYSNEGDVVLDFAFGSCSTGEACVKENRCFVGIELEEKYFNIAQERVRKHREELTLNFFNYENE